MTTEADLKALIPPGEQRAQPSSSQKRSIDTFFGQLLGTDPRSIYTVTVSKPGNLKVRFDQSPRGRAAKVPVALIERFEHLEQTVKAAAPFVGPGRKDAVVIVADHPQLGWGVVGVVEALGGPVVAKLAPEWAKLERFDPAPPRSAAVKPAGVSVPLAMDERTARMARLAVASSHAVFFVGPPGTGKNRLLREIVQEISDDPGRYGFSKARELAIEPAEETWSTRDLVGGETVDEDSRLRFRPGRVLDAIANDRWILIDEANRADLDKIFGGLLTWLAGDQVVVGRASNDVGSPLVRLGWDSGPDSFANGAERLSLEDVGDEPIDYVAGAEFRLLGTYNALDAHRVFRFGLALGRRFAHVPVPPAAISDFEVMLDSYAPEFPDEALWGEVRQSTISLYAAHFYTPGAQLGAGMLLELPGYITSALNLPDLATDGQSSGDLAPLLAEGYLLGCGAWLARLDEATELAALGEALTTGTSAFPPALSPSDWAWVVSQLPHIGG